MDLGLLLLRLTVGLTLAAHGAQKFGYFGGYGLAGTGQWLESVGFVGGRRNALAAGLAEVGGGLLLALGFLTPIASAILIAVMLVAAVVAHLKQGFFAAGGGYEYTLTLAAAALALAFTGPGAFSVDALFGFASGGVLFGVGALVAGVLAGTVQLAGRQQATPQAATAK